MDGWMDGWIEKALTTTLSREQVIMVVCVAVWAINIGHFNDPVHGGSWIKVGGGEGGGGGGGGGWW